jgi:hypothetical protein
MLDHKCYLFASSNVVPIRLILKPILIVTQFLENCQSQNGIEHLPLLEAIIDRKGER